CVGRTQWRIAAIDLPQHVELWLHAEIERPPARFDVSERTSEDAAAAQGIRLAVPAQVASSPRVMAIPRADHRRATVRDRVALVFFGPEIAHAVQRPHRLDLGPPAPAGDATRGHPPPLRRCTAADARPTP